MEPRGVVQELKISRFRYTQGEVGPATGGRGIVVDSSSGIAELGRQGQRLKNDRECDEKRTSSHRLPPGKGKRKPSPISRLQNPNLGVWRVLSDDQSLYRTVPH